MEEYNPKEMHMNGYQSETKMEAYKCMSGKEEQKARRMHAKNYEMRSVSYDPKTGQIKAMMVDADTKENVNMDILDEKTAILGGQVFELNNPAIKKMFQQAKAEAVNCSKPNKEVGKEERETDEVLKMSKAVYLSELAAKLLPEPLPGTPNTFELMIVFPNGKLLNRRFYKGEKVEDVANFCKVEMNTVDDIRLVCLDSKVELKCCENVESFAMLENTLLVELISINGTKK